jgi:outer membrane protein assembly factor BamB
VNKHLMKISVVGLIALAGGAGGCRSHNAAPAGDTIQPIPANSFKQQWSAALKLPATEGRKPGETVQHVYQRQDLLFVQTSKNRVYEFERGSGLLRTAISVVSPASSLGKPVAIGNRVVFPTNTTLEVYDRKGNKEKSVNFTRAITSGGAGEGNFCFFGIEYPGGGRLLAVDLSGDYRGIMWELQANGRISAAPAVHNHVVYAASNDGHLYAVSADENRKPVWPATGTFQTYGPVVADVQADDYGVYIASTDTKLYCVDRGSAKVKWQYLAGISLTDTPVVTASSVYQQVPGSGLAAIDKVSSDPQAYNRKPRWIAADAKQFLAEDEQHAYLLSKDNHIVAVDKQSGEELFRSHRTDFVAFASNNQDGTIYASTADGTVVAVTAVLKAGSVGQLVMGNSEKWEVASVK